MTIQIYNSIGGRQMILYPHKTHQHWKLSFYPLFHYNSIIKILNFNLHFYHWDWTWISNMSGPYNFPFSIPIHKRKFVLKCRHFYFILERPNLHYPVLIVLLQMRQTKYQVWNDHDQHKNGDRNSMIILNLQRIQLYFSN